MLTQAQQAQRQKPSVQVSLKGVSADALVHALIAAHGDDAHRFAQKVERDIERALANNG